MSPKDVLDHASPSCLMSSFASSSSSPNRRKSPSKTSGTNSNRSSPATTTDNNTPDKRYDPKQHKKASSSSSSSSKSQNRLSPLNTNLSNFNNNFSSHHHGGNRRTSGVLCILRVIVVVSSMIFVLVCILQTQHIQKYHQTTTIKDDWAGYHPGLNNNEWKLHAHGGSSSSRGGGGDGGYGYGYDNSVSGWFQRMGHSSKKYYLDEFEQKLLHWRQVSDRLQQPHNPKKKNQQQHSLIQNRFVTQQQQQQEQQQQQQQPAPPLTTTKTLLRHRTNTLSIPFWDQQLLFKNRNTWHLMVIIMVNDCFPHYDDDKEEETINQTSSSSSSSSSSYQNNNNNKTTLFPVLGTIQDAIQTNQADIIIYLPQIPKSTIFPNESSIGKQYQEQCQIQLIATIQTLYANELTIGKLQLVYGIENSLSSRIQYDYHHKLPQALYDWMKENQNLTPSSSNSSSVAVAVAATAVAAKKAAAVAAAEAIKRKLQKKYMLRTTISANNNNNNNNNTSKEEQEYDEKELQQQQEEAEKIKQQEEEHQKQINMDYKYKKFQEYEHQIRTQFKYEQLQLEMEYSLGLDLAYLAELVYQYGDLLFIVQSGTRLKPEYRFNLLDPSSSSSQQQQQQQQGNDKDDGAGGGINTTTSTNIESSPTIDYGETIIQQYEHYKLRSKKADRLVRRFCYMSFMEEDMMTKFPPSNTIIEDLPAWYEQSKRQLPTGIVLEKYGLYRLSMVLRSLLPYHKNTPSGLLLQYCTALLWDSQILHPIDTTMKLGNETTIERSDFPQPLWMDTTTTTTKKKSSIVRDVELVDTVPTAVEVDPSLVQQIKQEQQRRQQAMSHLTVPPWVTVDNGQLGPQRDVQPNSLVTDMSLSNTTTGTTDGTVGVSPTSNKTLVTFVIPTSTRPNGIKNKYVTHSLNQLFPLIRRDFRKADGSLDATVLLVICGNTADELDDHLQGLLDYYGPELKEGIVDIVSTNLETYPTLQNLPDNYGDDENRLRWRSKQNLDVSSSFFAAKGKSEYIMLLEDDTGYRDKFASTLKTMILTDKQQEDKMVPDPAISKVLGGTPPLDDYRQHVFAQIHFGFGYSGVLIHDDDALVYGVMHFVMMDEKPCDLLYLANYLQGKVLNHKYRWQLKKVLITHLGSVSSLKGKTQPVWGVKG